jgi:p-hydroxybenzoate 3-monooxygenase
MERITTQVGIIGAGPAGLFLAHWLLLNGIESVILEKRSRQYVESRVRAGLLEQNTVDILKHLGLADRLVNEGQEHQGVNFSFNGTRIRVPFGELTGGRNITIYGQQKVVSDLTNAWIQKDGLLFFEATAEKIEEYNSSKPKIIFNHKGQRSEIHCDFVAACDGFHGIGRKTLPKKDYRAYDTTYPFSWLGILARVAPSTDELIYAYHKNGFALHSLRSSKVSRLYLQVPNEDPLDNWPDERIWEELSTRLGTEGWNLKTGPVIEKGITPMRSYMIDNMQSGRLFLAGDTAHIVPPTGGKGLNLAVADVKHLVDGFVDFYKNGSLNTLNNYSKTALKRIWRAQEFSNFMTRLLHKQDEHGSFQYNLQKARFNYIRISEKFSASIAENYVGLPFEDYNRI